MSKRPISFAAAKAQFPHRFTMEHVPAWAKVPMFHTAARQYVHYAPQWSTDLEWYEATRFHGESELAEKGHCHSSGETWPLGKGFLREAFHLNRNQRAFDPAVKEST